MRRSIIGGGMGRDERNESLSLRALLAGFEACVFDGDVTVIFNLEISDVTL